MLQNQVRVTVEQNRIVVEGASAGGTPGGTATSSKRTVYWFQPDNGTPTYTGGVWPYVKVPPGASINSDVPGVSQGSGGTLLINGKPAYQFTPDTSAGDAKGNGNGGVWFWFEA
jgi:predicted lipoprotein with Yx(FWY)xxD motif